METRHQRTVDQTGDGPAQPSATRRPVETQGPEHDKDMDANHPVRLSSISATGQATADHLDRSGTGHDVLSASACQPATRSHGLETMGIRSGAGSTPVAGEVSDDQQPPSDHRRPRRKQRSDSDGSVNPQAILRMLEAQHYRCALSDRPLTPETASLDHIMPVSRGGSHCISNTQALDRAVNRAKGTLTNEEFITLCGDVWRSQRQHVQTPNNNPPLARKCS